MLPAVVAILLALPTFGAVASADPSPHELTLYVLVGGGLSPLPGDASQESAATRDAGVINAATVPLPTELKLPAGGIVHVHLDNRTASAPGGYTTRVVLLDEAPGALGRTSTILVQADVSANEAGLPDRTPSLNLNAGTPPAPTTPPLSRPLTNNSTTPSNVTLGPFVLSVPLPISGETPAQVKQLRDAWNSTVTGLQSSLVPFAFDTADRSLGGCGQGLSVPNESVVSACGVYHGYGDISGFTPCSNAFPDHFGLLWGPGIPVPFTGQRPFGLNPLPIIPPEVIPSAGPILAGQGVTRESLGICNDGPRTAHAAVQDARAIPGDGPGAPIPDPLDAIPDTLPRQVDVPIPLPVQETIPLPSETLPNAIVVPAQQPPIWPDNRTLQNGSEPAYAATIGFVDLAFLLPRDLGVPAGHSLGVAVELVCASPCAQAAPFEVGRQDALTRIELPVLSGPDASDFHPSAEPMAPGTHHGELADSDAAHDYFFHATVGTGVVVTGGTLFDPTGAARNATTAIDQDGTWLVRVTRFHAGAAAPVAGPALTGAHPTDTAFPYDVGLYVETLIHQNDAGSGADAANLTLSDVEKPGETRIYSGVVTRFDSADGYSVAMQPDETIWITLHGCSDKVKLVGSTTVPEGQRLERTTFSDPAILQFSVTGEGCYTFRVMRSQGWEEQVPNASFSPLRGISPHELYASAAGAELHASMFNGTDLVLRLSEHGVENVTTIVGRGSLPLGGGEHLATIPQRDAWSACVCIIDASGSTVGYRNRTIVPITQLANGMLLGTRLETLNAVVFDDHHERDLPVFVNGATVAPNGQVIARVSTSPTRAETISLLDTSTGAFEPYWIPPHADAPVFDTAGTAYAVASRTIGGQPDKYLVAFTPGGSGYFHPLARLGGDTTYTIAAIPAGIIVVDESAPGWTLLPTSSPGFPGVLHPLPHPTLPDLRVIEASTSSDSTGRIIRVTFVNNGDAAINTPFVIGVVDLGSLHAHDDYDANATLPGLPAHGFAIVEWHTSPTHAGTHTLSVRLDDNFLIPRKQQPDEVSESDESNNVATLRFSDVASTPVAGL